MNRIIVIFMVMLNFVVLSQTSEKYNSAYENFYRAEELFEKEQFGAARQEFREFIDGFDNYNDPMYIKASYYEAISALELYNNDAVTLLLEFNKNYPESIYKKEIYFKLGKHFYQKKKYGDALAWFNKLSIQDIEDEDKEEFYFKMGYANFKEKKFEEARSAFYEVKDGTSQYAAPALYYFSHIEYKNESYQIALNGFLKLEEDPKFGKVVPYYIAQIYYLQGKYEQVTAYASKLSSNESIVNEKDMNHLIGDAYYRTEKYKEAVPYLEKYNAGTKTSRDEDYRMGFSYYKSGDFKKAINVFDRVKRGEDSLAQVAYYHLGECLLALKNKVSARSAFEEAAFMEMDPIIQEDALYNYAILSYQLDINPYDEAVEAFEMYLKRYPNSKRRDDVYQYLVNVYMSTNNYSKALASLDKLPNKDVNLKTAYQLISFNQGVKQFQSANYPEAITSFKLVDKYPIDPVLSGKAEYWTADANYRLKNYDLAISGFKTFTFLPATLAPELKAEAQYNIGYSYLQKEELAKAIEAFRLYVSDPNAPKKKKADGLMRVADSYFVLKENEQAVKYYKEALAVKSGYEDQALFYMAKTYGYMNGMMDKKIERLVEIVENYKQSKYLQLSINEIALSYKAIGKLDNALQYFKKIVFDYPSSVLVVDAKINIADIYFKQGNYSNAETEYKKILDQHGSDSDVCEKAVRGLIEIYKALGQPEKVEQLVEQHGCANFTVDEQEELYYLPAIETYNDSSFQNAIPLFEKYLAKFSNGRYASEVKSYLANSHYAVGNIEKAILIYQETLEGPNNGFTEMAASRVAKYLYNNGRFSEVITYYKRLESVSSLPDVIFNAQLGLMRSYFLTEGWANAIAYSEKVLSNNQISEELKLEANYAQGMSNYYLKQYDSAKVTLVWVFKHTTTVKAAEARYSLADIFYQQNFLDEANDEITALLKQKPAYNYWIARGLILRTRVLIKQDNLFEAEQNLKSVLDHYPIPDDGILDEANELWDELMQLKDDPKSLSPDRNHVIEINEDEE